MIVGYLEAGCMVNLKTTEQKISLAVRCIELLETQLADLGSVTWTTWPSCLINIISVEQIAAQLNSYNVLAPLLTGYTLSFKYEFTAAKPQCFFVTLNDFKRLL